MFGLSSLYVFDSVIVNSGFMLKNMDITHILML